MFKPHIEDKSNLASDPLKIVDPARMAIALTVWAEILGYAGKKAAQAWRTLSGWVSDDLGYGIGVNADGETFAIPSDLRIDAVRKTVCDQASSLRNLNKRMLAQMPKKAGYVPNPFYVQEDGTFYCESILQRVWENEKQEVEHFLSITGNRLVNLDRKDASGNPLDPVAIDLTPACFGEDTVDRIDNVYRIHVPKVGSGLTTSKEEVAAVWTL